MEFHNCSCPLARGFYERLIGMVKRSLREATGRKHFTLEQLITLITEVEAVLNSRPLTYVYGDFNSGFVLTPSHFLVSNRNLGISFCSDNDDHSDPEFQIDKQPNWLNIGRKDKNIWTYFGNPGKMNIS